jgi:hypothetical protein
MSDTESGYVIKVGNLYVIYDERTRHHTFTATAKAATRWPTSGQAMERRPLKDGKPNGLVVLYRSTV